MDIVLATVLSVVVVALLACYIILRLKKKENLPPGPQKLPFLGTLPFHGFSPENFAKLGKQYGDICTIYIGDQRGIILNSYESIRTALVTNSNACSDRYRGWVFSKGNPNGNGIAACCFTQEMKKNRKEAVSVLHSLGFGTKCMEKKIQFEAQELVECFAKSGTNSFDPSCAISVAVANAMNTILFDQRYEHTDTKYSELVTQIRDMMRCGMHIYAMEVFPVLRFVPSFKTSVEKYFTAEENLLAFFRTKIQGHIINYTQGEVNDFIYVYLDKYVTSESREKCEENTDNSQYHEKPADGQAKCDGINENIANNNTDLEKLPYILHDLYIGGLETTQTSLNWLLLLLANRPEIQRKAQLEIGNFIEKERPISYKDKDKLNYVEAIIWEAQRFKNLVPLSIPHYTSCDSTISGHYVPAKTMIYPNLYSVHMNAETFPEPTVFKPERFLDKNGRFFRHPHLIPFSMGKRQCLGEVLARMELFLLTSTLLQHFTFLPPENVQRISEDGTFGFTLSPKPFQIRVVPIV